MTAIIRAGKGDLGVLSDLIAEAFHDLPPSRWLVADKAERIRIFPGYFRIFLEHALTAGTVETTPGRDAVALWIPAGGTEPPEPPACYAGQLAAATAPWTERFTAFDTALDRAHPRRTPHHHLAILAVWPCEQRKGLGTALLAAHHRLIDKAGLPAYLEASSERSRGLYLRHGYVPRPDAPVRLPDGPQMWPMWREPQSGPDTP